jgi:hypothetical protein
MPGICPVDKVVWHFDGEIQELMRSAGLRLEICKSNRRYFEAKFTKPKKAI